MMMSMGVLIIDKDITGKSLGTVIVIADIVTLAEFLMY